MTNTLTQHNDKNTKIIFATGILLLGGFFVVNPNSTLAFADVDPSEVDFTSQDLGPVHPGDFLVEKNVTLTQSINGFVNVTFSVYNEGTEEPCIDLLGNTVLHLTTENTTTLIPSPQDGFLLYDETFVGMPGVYHCNVVFDAVNATDDTNVENIGIQTVWIEAIGSKGYWNNNPDATAEHLPIVLGNETHFFEVNTNETATEIFEDHKGKFGLDKVAAQLLAAALNVWALMEVDGNTECIDQTIASTNDTLGELGYDGPGGEDPKFNKNNPYLEGLKANHTALDDFNNNGCPQP